MVSTTEASSTTHTLVVHQYLHLVALHDTNTGVCCPEVNADDGLSWFDAGARGIHGLDGWEDGEGADEDKEE
jgi:hypothetical protein